MRIYMNNGWRFSKEFDSDMIQYNYDDSDMEIVRLPHTNAVLPYNYAVPQDCEKVCCYRNEFTLGKEYMGKTILITFEGAAHEASVYINEKEATIHKCGYTTFTIDISSLIVFDKPNIIVVKLDSRPSLNQAPFGEKIDALVYGGLYREVYVDIKNPVYIDDIYVYEGKPEDYIKKEPETEQGKVKSDKKLSKNDTQEAENDNELKGLEITYELTVADKVDIRGQKGYYAELSLYKSDGTFIKNLENCEISKNIKFEFNDLKTMQSLRNKLNGKKFAGAINEVKRHIITCTLRIEELEKWELDNPNLYVIKAALKRHDFDAVYDEYETRFGIRKTEFKADGFYLNDKKIKLRGVNRNQSFPYMGYAMPESIQRNDADIIKNELGMNMVRTSHYPQSKYFLDRCDEIGLLVFSEIAGGYNIGDDDWKNGFCQSVEEMVLYNRNHPSVILWGVRVNGSNDDEELYTTTNNVAHNIDKLRQTAGTRNIKKSNLLEDVYAYNDFSYDGENEPIEKRKDVISDETKAYIISEYNGYMYPSKSFDTESDKLEHALRHAKIMNGYYKDKLIAGGIAWCMTDYNANNGFGSADGICYHGIMDMFRNPKLVASLYSCYTNENVLEISSSMSMGEHKAEIAGKMYIFSNADSVKMYKNGEFIKEFLCGKNASKKRSEFSALEFPPVEIDDLIGDTLEKQEGLPHGQAEDIKKILMSVSRYGVNHIPIDVRMRAAKLMTFYHMKLNDALALYEKYIGNGGKNMPVPSYKFEAIKDGNIVKTVVKEPVKNTFINAQADHTSLIENTTYDVALVRIKACDQNGNVLNLYNEAVMLSVEGAIKIIGPKLISLKGGYGGTFVRTIGESGQAFLTIMDNEGNVGKIEFDISVM